MVCNSATQCVLIGQVHSAPTKPKPCNNMAFFLSMANQLVTSSDQDNPKIDTQSEAGALSPECRLVNFFVGKL